jgi:hypothetical protein
MKSIKIKTILSSLFIVFLLTSCSKDDDNLGTVNISFVKRPSDVEIKIFTVENSGIAIYSSKPSNARKHSVQLNVGNYILRLADSSNGRYGSVGFQITPGKAVNIRYDEYWNGHIL